MAYQNTFNFLFESQASVRYRLEFWDNGVAASYPTNEGTLGKDAAKVQFGSEGSKMFSPLKPSTLTIDMMVTTPQEAWYITQLRNDRKERDVYVYLYNTADAHRPIFAGFLLMDLSDDPDISTPYPIKLRAVDGLAALKYYDFIPPTTQQRADDLYDKDETYIPSSSAAGGIFANAYSFTTWIARILHYAGPSSPTTGCNSEAEIQTSVNWFNGNMPNTLGDPLYWSRIKADQFYKKEGDTGDIKYKPLSCYDALIAICKTWGMRCFAWKNTFYFIQLNMYDKNNSGTLVSPVNIPYHRYEIDGTLVSDGNHIDINWGRYYLPVYLTEVNKKLAGSQYGVLPAYKKVTVDFMNVSNINYFIKFPELTSPWPVTTTAGTDVQYEDIGVFTFDGVNDQTFFQEIWLNMTNGFGQDMRMETDWTVQARKVGTTTWDQLDLGNFGTLGVAEWISTSGLPVSYVYFGSNQQMYPPGNSTWEICQMGNYWGSSWYPYQYVPCPASHFTAGDWEFRYKTGCKWSTGSQYITQGHGRCDPYPYPNGWNYTDPDSNMMTYVNSTITAGVGSSVFSPIINGAIGTASQNTQVVQTGDDTAFEEIKGIKWGDINGTNMPSHIEVWNGTAWVPSGFGGFWGLDTLVGTHSLSETLAYQVFARQAQNVRKFNTKIAMDLRYVESDSSGSRAMYSAPFTRWYTPSHGGSYTLRANWIMHSGTFEPAKDTWNLNLYEFKTFVTDTSTTTTNTGGTNTGGVGTGGTGIPDDPVTSEARLSAPTNSTRSAIQQLQLQGPSPIAVINEAQIVSDLDADMTVTALGVESMSPILWAGDTIRVQPKNGGRNDIGLTFVVQTTQEGTPTSIDVVDQVITHNISKGDIVTISQPDLFRQYQNKNKGTIGGFEIGDTSISKGGVEIASFINDDTMATAGATSLATSESIKTYIDTGSGGKLPKGGGTMTGAIDMGSNKITQLGAPTNLDDASTKAYVDGKHSYQYISFWSNSDNATNWAGPPDNGPNSYSGGGWNTDLGTAEISVGVTTASITRSKTPSGWTVPSDNSVLVGFYGMIRNKDNDVAGALGLFRGLWADFGGNTSPVDYTLEAYAEASYTGGGGTNYKGPCKVEDLTRSLDLNAGDVIYPAVLETSTDKVFFNITMVIKTPLV